MIHWFVVSELQINKCINWRDSDAFKLLIYLLNVVLFLTDRTNGRAIGTALRLSVCL